MHGTVAASLVWTGLLVLLSRHWLGDVKDAIVTLTTPKDSSVHPASGLLGPPGTVVHAPNGTLVVDTNGNLIPHVAVP